MRQATAGISRVIMILVISALAMIALFPFYSMVMMGTYNSNDLFKGIKWLPGNYTAENLKTLFTIDILRYYRNSLIAAFGSSALCVVVCSMSGYAFAKYDFRLKTGLYRFVILSLLIPTQVGIIAFVIGMRSLGWANTLLPLIIPPSASAFGTFWVAQFAKRAVPNEVLESGRIDGCSEFSVFARLAAPFMLPALTTLWLLMFLLSWNNLMTPLIVLSREELFTLPLGIRQLSTSFRMDYGAQILGLTIATLPILLFFSVFSKSLIGGLSAVAVKG
jgi:multiple sugar transport system permease protein/cellobiose transport system permease protein